VSNHVAFYLPVCLFERSGYLRQGDEALGLSSGTTISRVPFWQVLANSLYSLLFSKSERVVSSMSLGRFAYFSWMLRRVANSSVKF